MRRLVTAAAVAASPLAALAQTPPVSAIPSPSPGFQMPGTTVGTQLLRPVGTQIPKAAPAAGNPVGTTPGASFPTDLTGSLPGQTINKSAVVGPLPDSFDMIPTEPSAWDKFVARFGASLGFITPEPRAPNWTPGIARRNRERAFQKTEHWRRD
jgi:hypothetical protein